MSADTDKLIAELRAAAKPTKDLAGVGPRGPVYRTTKPAKADLFKRAADRIASLEAEREDARRQRNEIGRAWDEADARAKEAEARIASLEAALAPFADMAGEMFARGCDESNVAIALDNPDDPHRVTAGDFFRARRAASLSSSKQKDGE